MSIIKVLPESVVNKIAAGEVVERPASVVKELVENSLDAGAPRIDIEMEEAGKRLIRVTDNGAGMPPDDLALAFVSHATSKLQTSDDLFKITTLGFRGEALPSIGAVSQARIVSRAKGAPSGGEVEIRGGALGAVKERGAAEGTSVEVRNLFFNTPVRRKFLRSVPTEMSYISDMLTRLALAAPSVHFTLTHNGRQVFNLPPAQRLSDRIEGFFGKELAEDLIAVNWSDPSLTVAGFAAPPRHERSNTKMQFTFVNGRYVRDNTLLHAIGQTYHGLLLAKRCAIVFLFLKTAPDNVDVNVHPTKIE
ncbi:MAG: DNA mismatch repair endonuclease MutL, partial [Planctomycetes bacterium]|nr:DNA mismatch repair endonuclease MutL [Planctomycetota bacterium]